MSLAPGAYHGVLALSMFDSLVADPEPGTELTVLTEEGTVIGHFLARDFLREMDFRWVGGSQYDGRLMVRLVLPPGNDLLEAVDLLGNLWRVDAVDGQSRTGSR